MPVAVVTGSAGLIGAEAARFLARQGMDVVGIDNDMRRYFFGPDGSTQWSRELLQRSVRNYRHIEADVRAKDGIEAIFRQYGSEIALVIHAAAQPSHDWAAREPHTDFAINAVGTLNLLEAVRHNSPRAVFIFVSTNKVYGDAPNRLPIVELETRWELPAEHPYGAEGIDEAMSVDRCLHSLFGASKLAADTLVQEYGRYFGMHTACFRAGCLTGPAHSGAQLHGFLAYLVKCGLTGTPYTVFGYKGKQVRDNLHAADLIAAFWEFFQAPRRGEVYNIGGGRHANCSVLEAISLTEQAVGRRVAWSYSDAARIGDHIWWISNTGSFRAHYPAWRPKHAMSDIVGEIVEALARRLKRDGAARNTPPIAEHPPLGKTGRQVARLVR